MVSNLIKRFEDKLGIEVLGTGFPPQMVDDEPEEPGYEVIRADKERDSI